MLLLFFACEEEEEEEEDETAPFFKTWIHLLLVLILTSFELVIYCASGTLCNIGHSSSRSSKAR